jgi:hypothetical protein
VVGIGGSLVRENINKIRDEIREYYGLLNEVRLGARSKPPERPGYLAAYGMYKKFNTLPYAGGLADQPYLWTIEYMVIETEVEFMELLAAQSIQK